MVAILTTKAANAQTDASDNASGVVLDAQTQDPVEGALVEIEELSLSTNTEDDGSFQFDNALNIGSSIKIQAEGYKTQTISVSAWPAAVALAQLTAETTEETDSSDAVTVDEVEGEALAQANSETTQDSEDATVVEETEASVLRGVVVDEQDGRRILNPKIIIQGTGEEILTDMEGGFVIPNRPESEISLSVSAPDYLLKVVTIQPEDTDIEVGLKYSSKLEELLVVGRGTAVERRKVTNSIAKVDAEVLNRVPAENVLQALQGKVAGAQIQTNSGAPGGGIQLRLRGISTINGSSTPLYIVDGVFVSDAAIPNGISAVTASTRGSNTTATQDNQVNRTADLNPYDIADIQILKGASAAAIYGSKASNGVVIITTKRGDPVDPTFSFTQRVGFNDLLNKLGTRTYEDREEVVEQFGEDLAELYTEGQTFDHEEQLAGRNGLLLETSLSLSGGSEDGTHYYVSFLNRADEGIIPGTFYEKQSARFTIGKEFFDRLELTASAFLMHSLSDRGMTQNDNAGVSHYMVLPNTPNFIDLRRGADGRFPSNPFVNSGTNPLQTIDLMSNEEDVLRSILSLQGNLLVFETETQELRFLANGGIDTFRQLNELDFPNELFFEPNDGLPGSALNAASTALNWNVNLNAVHNFVIDFAKLGFTTSAGLQVETRDLSSTYIIGRNLTAGQPDVDAATQVEVSEFNREIRDVGFYVQEEVSIFDNLTLVGAIRGEKSSANSDADEFFFFPKAAASFAIPGLPSWIDLLKIRAAYGESGNLPLYGQIFTALNSTEAIDGLPVLTPPATVGASDLRPERQREFETGIDFALMRNRLFFEATYYQRNITDLLLQRTPAPSSGITSEFVNSGELQNRGIELTLDTTPFRNAGGFFTWNSIFTFTHNEATVLDLGGTPEFNTAGFGTSLGAFRIREGAPATIIFGCVGETELGECIEAPLGDAAPDFIIGFINTFQFKTDYGDLTLSFTLDWQQGGDVINLTEFLYDAGGNSEDFETAGAERLSQFGEGFTAPYIQDASYLKLRELSVFYDLPESVVALVPRARDLRLGFTGRNLFQVTDYRGMNPEVSNFGNAAIGRNIDVAPYPSARTFWFSVNATF